VRGVLGDAENAVLVSVEVCNAVVLQHNLLHGSSFFIVVVGHGHVLAVTLEFFFHVLRVEHLIVVLGDVFVLIVRFVCRHVVRVFVIFRVCV
jgi:hypothetical protein